MQKQLVEQAQSNIVIFGFNLSQWWSSDDIKAKLKRLEKEIESCHKLFVVSGSQAGYLLIFEIYLRLNL